MVPVHTLPWPNSSTCSLVMFLPVATRPINVSYIISMLSVSVSLYFGDISSKTLYPNAFSCVVTASAFTPNLSATFLKLGIIPKTPIDPVIVPGSAKILLALQAI